MLVGGVLGLAVGAVATLWALPAEPSASVPQAVAETEQAADIVIVTDGERNPFIGLRDDQMALERQIRTVVPTDEGPYRLEVREGVARMLVGLGFADANASEVVLTVRDGATGKAVLQRTVANEGSGKWQDVRVTLPRGTESVELALAPTGVAALSRPALMRAKSSGTPQNLILISLDTLRADFLGTYGERRWPTSPFLDDWAEGGTLFERAIAPSPWTLTSHMAMLTGHDPDELGMASNVGQTPRLEAKHDTLAELFSEAGYVTAAFTGRGTMSGRNGHADGFYLYQESLTTRENMVRDLDANMYSALRWLEANRGQPTFLFFHTFEAHAPYSHARFRTENPDSIQQDREAYASGIAYVDDRMKSFFAELDRLGFLADSMIVLTSDHGEMFAEHPPHRLHGITVYDEVLHVPLILRGPGIPKQRITTQVGTIDLFATIVDYFDLRSPTDIRSRSLRPLVAGEEESDREVYLCCMAHGPQVHGATDGRFKYSIYDPEGDGSFSGSDVLFDLEQTPLESHNAAASQPAAYQRLRAQTLSRAKRNLSRGRASSETREISAEMVEQLRALGYVE
jgi:arylsulfatase